MTDMEAKARLMEKREGFINRFFDVLPERYKDKARSDLDSLLTEAHREGMEEGIKQRQEAEEFQGEAIQNATLEEAAKVADAIEDVDGVDRGIAAAIRERIK